MRFSTWIIAFYLVIFTSCPAFAEGVFDDIPKASPCLSADDYLQCRSKAETEALQASAGKATRNGLKLTLKADDGSAKAFTDEGPVIDGAVSVYMLERYLPSAGFFLVERRCEGAGDYFIVSAADAKVKATGTNHPSASPAGDKVMMLDDVHKAEGTLFQVWTLKQHGQLAWEAKIQVPMDDKLFEGASAQWISDGQVDIRGEESLFKAVLANGKWTVKKVQ